MMENTGSEGGGELVEVEEQGIGQDPSNAPVETDGRSDGGQADPERDDGPDRAVNGERSISEPDDVNEDHTTPWFPTAEGSREEDDDEEEVIILDPEHPLVRRFQNALKNQLSRQLERVNMDLKDKYAQQKAEARSRQELGEEMYRVQVELARLQSTLEDHHRAAAQTAADRRQAQEQLKSIKEQYSSMADQASQERSHVSQLQTQMDLLTRRLFYMQEVNSELSSDITAMRNATRKAQAEKSQAEEYKYKQDLYVDRLTTDLERLTEQTAAYEAQAAAQKRETQAANQALSEAQMDMDSLAVERKQLLQQWDCSLVGMRRRDEAFSAMQEALGLARQQALSLEGEADGYRRSIVKEQENNEMMTTQLRRAQLDAAATTKLIGQSQAKQEALQAQYSTYTRVLQETQHSLARLNVELSAQQVELTTLMKGLQKEGVLRVELEDRIMSQMQKGLSHDKAAKYTRQLAGKMAALKKERMSQLWQLEAELASAGLESNEVSQRLDLLAGERDTLEAELSRRNAVLAASQAEMSGCMAVIERKQATINGHNKKIQQIAASTGNAELSPLQMQVQGLHSQLDVLGADIKTEQQRWMSQQGVLVALTRERQANGEQTRKLQTQFTILQQRKLRTQSEMEAERREQAELDKGMKTLRGDLLKLSSLVNKNSQLRQTLEQDNSLMETHFTHRLKDAERESVEMMMRLEKSQEEKERLVNILVEAERQIMLWEKKSQLARETRAAVDSDVGQGEIRTMRAEIHRMEVRCGQLQKQQERLLQESEAAVTRRETLVLRGGEAARATPRQGATLSQLHRALQGLRRSIQDTHKKVSESEQEIKELQESQVRLSTGLSQKNQELSQVRGTHAEMTSDLARLQDTKERNLSQLVTLQARAKLLQALREGRYHPLSSGEGVEEALRRQRERALAVSAVLQRLCQQSPEHQGPLRALIRALEQHAPSRSAGTETTQTGPEDSG